MMPPWAPVVFVHGLGSNAAAWRDVVPLVDRGGIPPELGGRRAVGWLVGTSAALPPDRVGGVSFVDPAGDNRGPSAEELAEVEDGFRPDKFASFVAGWYGAILADAKPETRAEVLATLAATPRDAFIGTFMGMLTYDPAATLARYPGPKHVL